MPLLCEPNNAVRAVAVAKRREYMNMTEYVCQYTNMYINTRISMYIHEYVYKDVYVCVHMQKLLHVNVYM